MAFGTGTAGVISRSTTQQNQQAFKDDKDGKHTEMTTFGATKTIETETYADAAAGAPTSGLTGAGPLAINEVYTESNVDYAKLMSTTMTVNI
jgi:hypothetical protein